MAEEVIDLADAVATRSGVYLAICRGCGTGQEEIQFSSVGDRNEWAVLHVVATGHVVVTTQKARV